jgi:HlyD family secretion protein
MKRLIVWILVLGVLAAAGYFGYMWWQRRAESAEPAYRTATSERQDLAWTISATGTIVPEDVVDVGTQVNGLIVAFGTDVGGKEVDYRSNVKEGAVLARIDDAIYAAQVRADEASLAQARASVQVSEATRVQAAARMDQSEREWNRAQQLSNSQAIAVADIDIARSNFEQAKAGMALATAQIEQAKAEVASAEAALVRSRRNLAYCTILSPVDGVIIDRRVDIGQTVVSSLNAPSLFLIAKDLARMQVLVQVNEADIGRVKPDEKVTFTCDAFPGERFRGTVRKVRLNATMTQNVVTYTVEIVTDNAGLKLLPYLTANVQFTLDSRENALVVPNGALRWAPSGAAGAETRTAQASRVGANGAGGGAPSSGAASAGSSGGNGERRSRQSAEQQGSRVWILRNGAPEPVNVQPGISDGTVTEIVSGDLREGDEVIIGQTVASAAAGGTNPFAPQMFRGGRGGGGGSGGARPSGAGR